MVDARLFQSLLAALRPHCRLILVGDADQLPSVGPGNVLSEILRADTLPTVRLNEIFRQGGQEPDRPERPPHCQRSDAPKGRQKPMTFS